MVNRKIILFFLIVIIMIAGGFALADALGVYNTKGYTAVNHGSHIHYVPTNRDPDISISRFPTSEPAQDEKITPTGQVIKKSE